MKNEQLLSHAKKCYSVAKQESDVLGRVTPEELYWGGYTDGLLHTEGLDSHSSLSWEDRGLRACMGRSKLNKQITQQIMGCMGCGLYKTRAHPVPGNGPIWTPLALVGEAPGAEEDTLGVPFIGASGKFLFDPATGVIPTVLGYQREHVRVTNCVRCRPPGNRNPSPEEVRSCAQFLKYEMLNIQPKVILCVGKFPATWFAGCEITMGAIRGKAFEWNGIPVVATYHPAYALRQGKSPAIMEQIYNDLAVVKEILSQPDQ